MSVEPVDFLLCPAASALVHSVSYDYQLFAGEQRLHLYAIGSIFMLTASTFTC